MIDVESGNADGETEANVAGDIADIEVDTAGIDAADGADGVNGADDSVATSGTADCIAGGTTGCADGAEYGVGSVFGVGFMHVS
jgi:hypothetical protein